eukprot:scaffold222013_cov37-Attheya_sp.AAC.2
MDEPYLAIPPLLTTTLSWRTMFLASNSASHMIAFSLTRIPGSYSLWGKDLHILNECKLYLAVSQRRWDIIFCQTCLLVHGILDRLNAIITHGLEIHPSHL